MTQLVLSLFPGIGLLDQAFEEEGFCVVRGPDLLWGGDVKRFHPPAARFDGVIGGPPCQRYSRLRHLVEHNGYAVAECLIPEFERCVREAHPRWFVMENVPEAPEPAVAPYLTARHTVNNRWFGGVQNRTRSFTFGHAAGWDRVVKEWQRGIAAEMVLLERAEYEPAVLASGGQRESTVAIGGSGKRKKTAAAIGYKTRSYAAAAAALQGLPQDFDLPPFTVAGKIEAIGNGVPLPMGRAIARAVRRAVAA